MADKSAGNHKRNEMSGRCDNCDDVTCDLLCANCVAMLECEKCIEKDIEIKRLTGTKLTPTETHAEGRIEAGWGDSNALISEQQAPTKNVLPAVWDLVIKDMTDRDKEGERKYSTRLQPFNGRDALIDVYQELLDAVVYMRQTIYERDGK